MVSFDRAFVAVGLAWLIIGMIFGLYMGITNSNQFVVAHVAMLLPGAVVLILYGLIYRAWPALNDSGLARAQFWIAVIAVFGLVFGSFQFVLSGGQQVAIVASASVLAIIAALLMGWMFLAGSAD
jgi:hypothetical protein